MSNSFTFCLSWNTNGWNHEKKDTIEYFIASFKPLFVCFQETGNGSGSTSSYPCRVSLRNYKYFFKKADNSVPGKRGLYLGFHKSCQASPENNSFNYILSLQTFSLWNNTKCSIGNVYIPQKRHSIFVKHAKTEVLTWLQNHSSHPSILIGDFNLSTSRLLNWISSFPDWHILQVKGSSISWISGNRSSDIDHALVNSKMNDLLTSGYFVDYYPVSDHKPLILKGKSIPSDDFLVPKKVLRWDRVKCLNERESILNNNRFQILDNLLNDPNSSSDILSKEFVSTAFAIANDLNITSYDEIIKASFHMSQGIFNLQKIKMKLYRELTKKNSLHDLSSFLNKVDKYLNLCKVIHKKCNEYRKQEYLHWIKVGCEYVKSHNPKKAWKWIHRTAKTGKKFSVTSKPIKDKNGNLVSSTEEQLVVWHDHFEKLASDPSGVSLDLDSWYATPSNSRFILPYNDEWDINQEISIEEIKTAIMNIPNYKASGPDEVPIEFFKALVPLSDPEVDNNTIPSGLIFLHKFFNKIWDGDFPSSWNEASIVSIPKKGDLSDCDNYRGISLINNGIKLISKIATTRISEYGLRNNFIRPEQFGFRNKEECISLFITIYEICRRRQIANKETYLAFLDFRKAYDSVPIGNILHKIDCLGIRGKCFQFIKNLYLTSKANVKVDGQFSDSFNIMKGVRQGCPLSPILFNLFINDIFKDCEDFGVPLGDTKCCGGLFADDVVLCAPSRSYLKKLLKRVNEWAIHNKMTFGINKCATMVVRPDSPQSRSKQDPTFYLAGQPIPKTSRYTYLGIPFDKSLSLDPIVNSLNNKVLFALSSVKRFLSNPYVPIPYRKTVLNSIVISRVSYFAPLLGSNKSRSRSAQSIVNKGLNYIAGVKNARSLTSLYCTSKDLNIPPLSAKCALAQVRCFNKWKDSNCIISCLVNEPSKSNWYTWTKSSSILKNKLSKFENEKAIKNHYWNDMKKKSIKASSYEKNNFEETIDFLKLCYDYPDLYYGFYWLLKARSGYKLDASVAKAAKMIDKNCPNYCPLCKTGKQTIEHWLTRCPFFQDIRNEFSSYLNPISCFFNNNCSNSSSNANSIENAHENSDDNVYDNPNNSSIVNPSANSIETSTENSIVSSSDNSIENSTDCTTEFNYENSFDNTIENTFDNFTENSFVNTTDNPSDYFSETLYENSIIDRIDSSNENPIEENNSIALNQSLDNNISVNDPLNNNVYNDSSVCTEIFKFLLGGRNKKFYSREWKDLCSCQLKNGNCTDTPFLVVTAALLNKIMPIAIGRQWSMFNRYPKTKSVNAEETVRQDSRSSATGNDHNFTT